MPSAAHCRGTKTSWKPEQHPKNRYTQSFTLLTLGVIYLNNGYTRITLKATSKATEKVCDVKST